MFSNTYIQERMKKAEFLRESGLNPYRNDAKVSMSNAEFLDRFSYLKDSNLQDSKLSHNTESNFQDSKDSTQDIESNSQDSSKSQNLDSKNAKNTESNSQETPQNIWLKGRVKFLRMMGKASFIKIEDGTATLQIYFSQNELGETFKILKKALEVGDIVNVCGFPFVTKTGELSLHATQFKILTKAIVPLPEKFHGLQDIELRYRQRYLDLIVNSEVKRTFITRSKIVSLVRHFFESKGFLEVETPMLHPIPGGANARPFVTHHNALDVERYLRIAPELYLKRLIVGGFEAVFEINRNFRNEGIDHSHNPEFSMIEFYWAYRDYRDLIDLSIELFNFLLDSLKLGKVISFDDKSIDFSNFSVMTYIESLASIGGIDSKIILDRDALEQFLKEKNIRLESGLSHAKLLNEAFDNFVESKLINPTFITEYPLEISPLARRSDKDFNIADRFELFIGGKEIANGFSELNDPIDQLERFKAQVALKDKGDEEAQYMDEDYVWALGHGMPPTAGQGIGIDRLVMLLTNNKSIKDVILFPAMKPLES